MLHVERGSAINCSCDKDVYVVAVAGIEVHVREELLEGVFHCLERPLLSRTANSAKGLGAKVINVSRESSLEEQVRDG